MDSLYAFKCKCFRNTRHIVTFGIPVSRDALSWTSNEAFSKLFHCSVRNTKVIRSPLNLCSRLVSLNRNTYDNTLNHLHVNYGNACGGGIGHYSTTCIKLAMFCYIMTIQFDVYAHCIHLYTQLYTCIILT
jgi:hypothetical protein